MLLSLSIKDFVLIEDATLELSGGMTVLSGETGAGKTLLTQALGLLVGDRAQEGLVRESSEEALIQGVFELSNAQVRAVPADARELVGLEAGEVVATRRLSLAGKNRCFLDGVSVSLTTLAEVLGEIISFSGQHEHRRLLRPPYQLNVIDAFAGSDHLEDLAGYQVAWKEARRLQDRLGTLRAGIAEREREATLLRFQVDELNAAALDADEEERLVAEQRLLARVEEMIAACSEAGAHLRQEYPGGDAAAALSAARARLAPLQGVDESVDAIITTLEDLAESVGDTARELRSFADGLEPDPQRLREVDERLRTYSEMSRKYGGTTAAAVAFHEESRARLDSLETSEHETEEVEARLEQLRVRCVESAAGLTERRRAAARELEEAVRPHLVDLGMTDGRLRVEFRSGAGWEDLTATGADSLEFHLATSNGGASRPLARTASGGELSRVLLAVKTALRGCEASETVVFDEVDAGVGGLTATAVGAKLREISSSSQVVVVTHLPQVAAFADRHYAIRKEVTEGGTVTRLEALDEHGSLEELCRMMGGTPGDPGALAHARALRDRAAAGLID